MRFMKITLFILGFLIIAIIPIPGYLYAKYNRKK
jgi:hypothetical protein